VSRYGEVYVANLRLLHRRRVCRSHVACNGLGNLDAEICRKRRHLVGVDAGVAAPLCDRRVRALVKPTDTALADVRVVLKLGDERRRIGEQNAILAPLHAECAERKAQQRETQASFLNRRLHLHADWGQVKRGVRVLDCNDGFLHVRRRLSAAQRIEQTEQQPVCLVSLLRHAEVIRVKCTLVDAQCELTVRAARWRQVDQHGTHQLLEILLADSANVHAHARAIGRKVCREVDARRVVEARVFLDCVGQAAAAGKKLDRGVRLAALVEIRNGNEPRVRGAVPVLQTFVVQWLVERDVAHICFVGARRVRLRFDLKPLGDAFFRSLRDDAAHALLRLWVVERARDGRVDCLVGRFHHFFLDFTRLSLKKTTHQNARKKTRNVTPRCPRLSERD